MLILRKSLIFTDGMTKLIITNCIFLLSFIVSQGFSQEPLVKKLKLVQFSGIVVSGDSLDPVSYASITIKGNKKGILSDYNGFFSFVANCGETVYFNAFGYKPASYKIPDSLELSRYSWIQVLTADTIYLSEAVIVPWPTKEQFARNFVSIVIPNDDQQRAEKNLNLAIMKEKYQNYPMDGAMNYRNFIEQQVAQNYYNGQYRPNNLLNPFAWAQFVKAWKEGKFKKKK